jgi:hypothetical protein
VERDRRDFEGKPARNERYAREKERIAAQTALGRGSSDRHKVGGARNAVYEADAVKQQGRCERAQKEIFDCGFIRRRQLAPDAHQNVRAQGHQFEPEVEDQQVDR